MNNKLLSTFSALVKKYPLGKQHVTVHIKENPFHLPPEALFSMAERINRKRGFLFVSRVLGKHIPVKASIPQIAGSALAALFLESHHNTSFPELTELFYLALTNPDASEEVMGRLQKRPFPLPEPTLFIGFAETATALGHAMFASFSSRAQYIHTTREQVAGYPSSLSFEEKHSHATTHRCYPQDEQLLASPAPIVLVDDEMTTGRTALNLIRSIQQRFPRSTYVVASLLDWRSAADREQFTAVEKELGVQITTLSLMSGFIEVEGTADLAGSHPKVPVGTYRPQIEKHYLDTFKQLPSFFSEASDGTQNSTPYLEATGRFGLDSDAWSVIKAEVRQAGEQLQKTRKGSRTLCMGTGEFMYLPFQIASHMGPGVYVQSTTRSPIQPKNQPGYAVHNGWRFPSPEDPSIINYIYNIPSGVYDEIYLFLEREVPTHQLTPLYNVLSDTGIKTIHLVVCSRQS